MIHENLKINFCSLVDASLTLSMLNLAPILSKTRSWSSYGQSRLVVHRVPYIELSFGLRDI